ncbi:phage tail tape measure protein [Cupriavidus sp. SW-Y-13]|uniref:phage tail tape measure protein n=1 Tax=Cupriavidus sp. SW-Y-13 TaxID=2653854 RepID=UPI0013651E00|nr:phage tail tape measure protein [Cupriavidus sp. SW-Y-13]MWL87145.1 phage tail tape measure protein [Cupriavidus sp. SW-Y-13]
MSTSRNLRLEVLLQAVDRVTRPFKAVIDSSSKLAKTVKATRDELKALERTQGSIDSFRKLSKEVTITDAQLRKADAHVKALGQQIDAAARPTAAMTRAFQKANIEADRLRKHSTGLQTSLTGVKDRLTAAGISTATLRRGQGNLTTQIQTTTAALARQEAQLKAVGERQRRVAAATASADRMRGAAGTLAAGGATSAALGAGTLLGARRLLAPGGEYNAEMSRVQALSRLDKNSEAFQALRAQSRHLGATTSFTATQAAEGQGFLAMAGFTPDEIIKAMPGTLAMAKAGTTDLGVAADISSNVMSGFGLEADQMGRVSDVLTMAFTSSNTTLQMLGDTMKYAGPVAKAAGMSFEQAAATAGLLGNAGIQGSQAGTTLRAMILRLASPTSKASKALGELGVSSLDLKGNVRDIPSILSDVAAQTEKMGSGDRLGYLKRIFGEEPAAGMAELIERQGTKGIDKYTQILTESAGTANRVAATMADNLKGDLQTLESAWQDLGISVSDTVDKPLRSVTQTITDAIRTVSQWTKENPELAGTLAKVAIGLGVLFAALGTISLTLAAVLVPMAAIKVAFGVLGVKGSLATGVLRGMGKALKLVLRGVVILSRALLMNPIGLAISAIAVAALLIYKYWEPIKAFFVGLWGKICGVFSGGIGSVTAFILNWSPYGLFYSIFTRVLSWFGVDMPEKFTDFGANLLKGLIKGVTSLLPKVRETIGSIGDGVVGWFKEKLGIRSPSRVFARLGGFTMEGLDQGLENGQGGPLGTMARVAKVMTGLGAGISFAAAAPAIAGVTFDKRPPLAASSAGKGVGMAPAPIVINVYPPAGTNEQTIARMVATEIQRVEARQQARVRSRLTDQD